MQGAARAGNGDDVVSGESARLAGESAVAGGKKGANQEEAGEDQRAFDDPSGGIAIAESDATESHLRAERQEGSFLLLVRGQRSGGGSRQELDGQNRGSARKPRNDRGRIEGCGCARGESGGGHGNGIVEGAAEGRDGYVDD